VNYNEKTALILDDSNNPERKEIPKPLPRKKRKTGDYKKPSQKKYYTGRRCGMVTFSSGGKAVEDTPYQKKSRLRFGGERGRKKKLSLSADLTATTFARALQTKKGLNILVREESPWERFRKKRELVN